MKPRNALKSVVLAGGLLIGSTAHSALLLEFQEDLGNFPDAIEVGGGVTTLGGQLGLLFTLSNTSYDNGSAGSGAFEQDPDGDFADNDVLTNEARAAISARQPFGIYEFNVKLPDFFTAKAGVFTQADILNAIEAPDLFDVQIQASDDVGFDEYIFSLSLSPAEGLLFDSTVKPGDIPSLFVNPRTGMLEFFVPALYTASIDQLVSDIDVKIRNSPGLDIATSMAWVETDADGNSSIETEFSQSGVDFNGEELRPRGEIQGKLLIKVPEPGSLALLGVGLLGLSFARRSLAFRALG